MRSDKRQTFAMIGIALLVAAGILAYIGVSQPKIYDGAGTLSASDSSAAQSAVHQEGSNNVIVSNSGNGNVSVQMRLLLTGNRSDILILLSRL